MKAFQRKLSDPGSIGDLHDHHIFEEREARRDAWDEAHEHEEDLRQESIMSDESERQE